MIRHLDQAYTWPCHQRKNHGPHSDIWDFRTHWLSHKDHLITQLKLETYKLQPVKRIPIKGKNTSLWSSQDALVLKALTLTLTPLLKPHLSKNCTHLKNNGGSKKAVRQCLKNLDPTHHVMKSDVKGYYDSMNHHILYHQFCDLVPDSSLRRLVWQYLKRTINSGENYIDIERGISLGCPLSPLMAALTLKPLDDAMEKLNIFYTRFMDDWVIIGPKWKLRKAVKVVNQCLTQLKVEKHPDKTFIGKTIKGFTFLKPSNDAKIK